MAGVKQDQVDKAEQLQELLLDDLIKLFKDGEATSTDRATLARLLKDNGWSVDPSMVPQELKEQLTSKIAAGDDIEDDVVPISRAM